MRLEIVIDFVHLEDWWLSLSIAAILILLALRGDSIVAAYRSWNAPPVEQSEDDIIAAVRKSSKTPIATMETNVNKVLKGEPVNMGELMNGFMGAFKQIMNTPLEEPRELFSGSISVPSTKTVTFEDQRVMAKVESQKSQAEWTLVGDRLKLVTPEEANPSQEASELVATSPTEESEECEHGICFTSNS